MLSKNVQTTRGKFKYCPNHTFDYENDKMIFTSVVGHLYDSEFPPEYKNWNTCDEFELFDAEIIKSIKEDLKGIKENIQNLSKNAQLVIIWTDCDREGENIGFQIKTLINKKIVVKRARFSGISKHEIKNAFESLCEINLNESNAVDARIELDLRCGSVFTRLQTLHLQKALGKENAFGSNKKQVISYGQCQIPTLNFVVERQKQIDAFVPETFYSLKLVHNKNEFSWERGNVFDKNFVVHMYNILFGAKYKVKSVNCKEIVKYSPLPLRTVELQKTCASFYKMSGDEIMTIAEKLYNRGYISYPRTETDSFQNNFGFKRILEKLKEDEKYAEYLEAFEFKMPRKGKNDDQAHSPIYPLKGGNDLSGKDRNVYDFVARRFMGCCSKNATADETTIEICASFKAGNNNLVGEYFKLKGIKIKQKNYLNIYIYESWGDKEIKKCEKYTEGSDLNPEDMDLSIIDSRTTSPCDLTEKDLIVLMDKNGIGTDATIHEHISKIQARNYAYKVGQYIRPTDLGMNLINAYKTLELPIHECKIRKEMEENLISVCAGKMRKEDLVQREIKIYKEIYTRFKNQIEKYVEVMKVENDFKKTTKKNTGKTYTDVVKKQKVENFTKNESILCKCRENATRKQCLKGKNKNRYFYGCFSFPKKCDFFMWEGEENKGMHFKRSEVVDEVKCDCGKSAVKKTSSTEKNLGRQFYVCNKSYKQCKFFQWVEK
ncbi:Top3a [Ecytonucleospora hepatopenaei]|uniref:DNA topoisomerase n=1 Tax=Ecytonucleospora hepatopenaei TaxID=646526 RepID=A0A1W0E6I5_9MICR|nr:Top3a [Ecytonucleospora hepatopenaei]